MLEIIDVQGFEDDRERASQRSTIEMIKYHQTCRVLAVPFELHVGLACELRTQGLRVWHLFQAKLHERLERPDAVVVCSWGMKQW
jgi:hypothetical protein